MVYPRKNTVQTNDHIAIVSGLLRTGPTGTSDDEDEGTMKKIGTRKSEDNKFRRTMDVPVNIYQ